MEISRVGVVGLGTMGSGIAQICIEAGVQTIGRDVSAEACDAAREKIGRFLDKRVEKSALTSDARDSALACLQVTTKLEDLAACDLIIEAAFESLEVKQHLFAELESVVREDAILVTNTSALSVTEIAAATRKPERVVGMHFFNPVPLMKLVEVVRAERMDEGVVQTAMAFAERIGKRPVCCNDTPGFIVNRLLLPLMNDCLRVLDEADVTIEDLDTALTLGAGWPMGPGALCDLVGLDVHVHATEALYERIREPRMAPPPRLRRMVDAGKLGRKSGQGFYGYTA